MPCRMPGSRPVSAEAWCGKLWLIGAQGLGDRFEQGLLLLREAQSRTDGGDARIGEGGTIILIEHGGGAARIARATARKGLRQIAGTLASAVAAAKVITASIFMGCRPDPCFDAAGGVSMVGRQWQRACPEDDHFRHLPAACRLNIPFIMIWCFEEACAPRRGYSPMRRRSYPPFRYLRCGHPFGRACALRCAQR